MIRLKHILYELSSGAKNKLRDTWKKQVPNANISEFDFYIDTFEKNNKNPLFSHKDIFQYKFEDLKKIIDLNFSKEKVDADYINDFDLNSLSTKDKEDLIYEDDGLVILLGNSRPRCVRYGQGYSWCISKFDTSNMFASYRFVLGEKIFYFVFDKNLPKSNPNHALVVLVDKNLKFNVADVTNNSNSGGSEVEWNYILELQPKLKGLEKLFKPMPLVPNEKEEYEFNKKVKSDDNYERLDFDQKEKYISFGHNLSDGQYLSTPYNLKLKYINLGHEITSTEFDQLKEKDRERYCIVQLKMKKFEITDGNIAMIYIDKVGDFDKIPSKYKNAVLRNPKSAYDIIYQKFVNGEDCSIGTFPELEKVIATSAKWSYHYTNIVIEGRFPEAEPVIAQDAKYAYEYAYNVINGRFEAGEPAIVTNVEYSYKYARDVIKGRFPAGESIIAQDSGWSYQYARDVIKGRFPEGEPVIAHDSVRSYKYAKNIIRHRFPEGEPVIATDADASYYYAKDVINGRFEAGEPVIAQNIYYSYFYALNIIKGRFEAGEPTIATDAEYADKYAKNVIRGRFEAGEPAIATDANISYDYATDVIKGRFEAGEPAIFQNVERSYAYAKNVIRGRFEAGEPVIAQNIYYSYFYALNIIKGRFEAGEPTIATDAEYADKYAKNVIRGRFEAGEPAIATSAELSYQYARDVIKGRFPEGEPAIATDDRYSRFYKEMLNDLQKNEPAPMQENKIKISDIRKIIREEILKEIKLRYKRKIKKEAAAGMSGMETTWASNKPTDFTHIAPNDEEKNKYRWRKNELFKPIVKK